MKRRINMREVADAAGVHPTTVSRALRNHPALPQQTRERIQQIAQSMGYVPDPLLCALNTYRIAQRRIVSHHGTIAWLEGTPLHIPRHKLPLAGAFDGATQRAEQLGYKLERFRVSKRTPEEIRLIERQLRARGVSTIIIASQFQGGTILDLNWENYSAVSVSLSLANPNISTVVSDHFGNMLLIMEQLRLRGYRRIGLLLEERLLSLCEDRWLAGYLLAREADLPENRLQPLYFRDGASDAILKKWYKANKPDAIITEPALARKRLQPLFGISVPYDIGMAYPSVSPDTTHSGIEEDMHTIGVAAVEQLVRMDQNSERGLSANPLRIYVRGRWRDGQSVRELPPVNQRPPLPQRVIVG